MAPVKRLFEAGALEVFTVPIGMKKSRPGTLIQSLCREQDRETVVKAIFKHTSTIGVREVACNRYILERTTTALGAHEKTAAYPMSIACYLQNDCQSAALWFEKCLPCADEMAIAVIYWHTLSCFRAECERALLKQYHADMKVGHHMAYRLAVSAFCGDVPCEQALSELEKETDDLNYAIAMYGLCVFIESQGKSVSHAYMKSLLECDSVWPCISYLAA